MKKLIGIAILVTLATAAWAQQPSPSASSPAAPSAPPRQLRAGGFLIAGTIVDIDTGKPLAKTTVAIESAEPMTDRRPIASMVTGPDGRFRFDKLAAGKYGLRAQRHGYPLQGLDAHEGLSTAVVVGPNLEASDILFRIHPDASIVGHVYDEANDPVANAQVIVFRRDNSRGREHMQMQGMSSTRDDGAFRLGHLQPGTYIVAVSAMPWYAQRPQPQFRQNADGKMEMEPGKPTPLDVAYPLTFFGGATEPAGAAPIELQAGDHGVVDVQLSAVPALHLTVHLPENQDTPPSQGPAVPVPPRYMVNLQRNLFGFDSFVQAQTSFMGTAAQPVVELGGVAPGHYEIRMSSTDRTKPFEAHQEIDAATSLEMDSARISEVPATVSGSVEMETQGTKRGDLRVSLQNVDGYRGYGTVAGPDGKFEMQQKVLPGTYTVSVGGNPPAYLKSITAAGARVSGYKVEIASGTVKLSLVAGQGMGTLDGVVTREGKPKPGAMVVLVPADLSESQLFRRDQSDTDGSFTLQQVVPGKYTVIAIDDWNASWQMPDVLKKYLPSGQTLQVSPGGKYQARVEVQ